MKANVLRGPRVYFRPLKDIDDETGKRLATNALFSNGDGLLPIRRQHGQRDVSPVCEFAAHFSAALPSDRPLLASGPAERLSASCLSAWSRSRLPRALCSHPCIFQDQMAPTDSPRAVLPAAVPWVSHPCPARS